MKPDSNLLENQSTAAYRGNLTGRLSTSGTNTGYRHGEDAEEAVNLPMAYPPPPVIHARSWNADEADTSAFTGRGQDAKDLSDIVSEPPQWKGRAPAATLHPLQEWEGYVIEIGETDFTARLLDLTAGASFEEEEADFPLAKISETDAAKMQIGSIFRWVIGYERSAMGTKKRVSRIVFRDLPAVTRSDQQAGEAWAQKIMAAFKR